MLNNTLQGKISQWKELILSGNNDYRSKDYNAAIEPYLQAKNIALNLFANGHSPNDSVPMLVISHQNLADTYKKLKDLTKVYQELEQAHNVLVDSLDNAITNSSEMRQAIYGGISKTRTGLVKFLEENPLMFNDDVRTPLNRLN